MEELNNVFTVDNEEITSNLIEECATPSEVNAPMSDHKYEIYALIAAGVLALGTVAFTQKDKIKKFLDDRKIKKDFDELIQK